MTIIGSAYVEIHADVTKLQREIDNAMKKIKDPILHIKADLDLTKAKAQLKAFQNEVKHQSVKINLDANFEEIIDNLDVLKKDQEADAINLNIATDTKQLDEALIKAKKEFNRIDSTIHTTASTKEAEAEFEFLTRARQVPINTSVSARDLAVTEAKLDALARNRNSKVSVGISKETEKAFQRLLFTVIGAVPADTIRNALTSVASGFEALSLKATSLATAIGSITSAGLTLGANLFSLAGDLTKVIGIAAVAPAVFAAFAAGITGTIIAWNNFTDAFKPGAPGEKALAKLPIEAQNAVIALKELGKEFTKPIQQAFWEKMGTSLQDTAKVILPVLQRGLIKTNNVLANLTKSMLKSFEDLAKSGGLDRLFNNIAIGFKNLGKGIVPFFNALNTLSVSGSKFLGRLGTALANLGIRFNNFITSAEKAGKIDDWIEGAITAFKDLGSIVGSTVGIFQGLTKISDISGGKGLTEFANGMANISKKVNSEPFATKLVSILKNARAGTEALGKGFRELGNIIGNSTTTIGLFLRTAGEVGGQALTSFSKLFKGTGLGDGLMKALVGLQGALKTLEPAFHNIGIVISDLGEIAGAVFTNAAPGIKNLVSTIQQVVAGLKDGIIAAMPIFNGFFQAIFAAAQGPVVALARGVGDLLKAFAGLPGPIQSVIITLGVLLALRGKISGLFTGISKGLTNFSGLIGAESKNIGGGLTSIRNKVTGETTLISNSAAKMFSGLGTAAGHFNSFKNAIGSIPFAKATSGFGGIATSVGGAVKSLGKAGGAGLLGALAGGVSMLGGPWGIAIGAGILAVSAFGQAQEESKSRVENLSTSLNQQTGAITGATKALLAKNFFDGATSDWDNFVRGVLQNSKSVEETFKDLGISTQTFTDKLSNPKSRDAFVGNMKDIVATLDKGQVPTKEMAEALGTTQEALLKIKPDSLRHLAEKAGNAADELRKAQEQVEAIAKATGTSSDSAAILARNYETLSSAASSASEKFSALKQNLDLLNHNAMTTTAAQKGIAQATINTKSAFAELAKIGGPAIRSFVKVGEGFKFSTQESIKFHDTISASADSILQLGTATLDKVLKETGNADKASQAALAAMQPAITGLRQSLSAIGLSAPQIDEVIKQLGLMPDQVETAIHINTDDARKNVALLAIATQAYATGNWTAVLAALPDPAKKALSTTKELANAFATGHYEAVLKALDSTKVGKEAALATILSVTDGNYEAALKALNLTKPGVHEAKIEIGSVQDKSISIRARDDATRPIFGIKSAEDQLYDKTITITSRNVFETIHINNTSKAGPQANGGMFNTFGTQIFANGGFSQFAGGTEKHIAQIAQGRWPIRMWAEPETGGEAYIPLALTKRVRSLKILEKVAEMFGYSLFKKFANGGFFMDAFGSNSNLSLRGSTTNGTSVVENNSSSSSKIININTAINATEKQNPQQLADAVATSITWQLLNRAQ